MGNISTLQFVLPAFGGRSAPTTAFLNKCYLWLQDAVSYCNPSLVAFRFEVLNSRQLTPTDVIELIEVMTKAVGKTTNVRTSIVLGIDNISIDWIHVISRTLAIPIVDLDCLPIRAPHPTLDPVQFERLRLLSYAHKYDLIDLPQARWTIDSRMVATKWFHYLIEELGFRDLDPHFPFVQRNQLSANEVNIIAQYLTDIHKAWNALGRRDISVAMFDQFLNRVRTSSLNRSSLARIVTLDLQLDGTIGFTDGLSSIYPNRIDISKISLAAFLDDSSQQRLEVAETTIATDCHDCAWVGFCRSGSQFAGLIHRYDPECEFENKSIFCTALDEMYASLAKNLIERGTDQIELISALEELRRKQLSQLT